MDAEPTQRPSGAGFHAHRARRTGLAGLLLALALAGGASAQPVTVQPLLIDSCLGSDHPPFDYEPPTNANSLLLAAGSLEDAPAGAEAILNVEDPGGQLLSGTGPVDEIGGFQILVGIQQFDTHTVKGPLTLTYTTPEGTQEEVTVEGFDGRTIDVGPEEVPCDKSQLREGSIAAPPTTTVTTGTTAPPTTEAATPGTVVAGAEDDEDGDDGGWLTGLLVTLIIIGILLILLGLFFWWWRPRQRFCDWSAYYEQGGNRIPLRTARGHECCVYTVRVRSALDDFDFASKGRQAPDTLDGVEEAPEGRLRIFDTDHAFVGLDLYAWVGARSGPFGRLDWMQADAAARTRLPEGAQPNESYRWQLESHEEPPDVAIHLRYAETTTATIDLDSGCPNHKNTYTGAGTSTAHIEADHECSNTEPGPECPVELTAMSYSGVSVNGDLTYVVKGLAGSDTDELEGHAGLDVREVNGVTFYGSHVDSHDHPARPRTHYGANLTDNDNRVVSGDNYKVFVRQAMELDAGSIVPTRVWSTTEEVSAHAQVDFDHDISVKAAMDPCTKKDCCGHGKCRCMPRLELVFRNQRAWIQCDGTSYPLSRNNLGTAVGANAPWQLG